ncbi:endonuclease domain-containing protein [Brevundimonas sp. NPDC092305]|uniref:endonuclease domain-containing protein n=1 Tax=Brevundimonas sp. NPDC092305 TaxID=3363957 RepID=UPI00381E88B7
MTPPEAALWSRLRGREPGRPSIRRQHPIGPYILDLYCATLRRPSRSTAKFTAQAIILTTMPAEPPGLRIKA